MSAQHTPGPWRAVEVEPVSVFSDGRTGRPHWEVVREVRPRFEQTMKSADGKTARFPNKAAALAAIAKATGEAA